VVVDFHGGPEAQSTPGFSLMEQLYVDEGFVYVSPNVRGSDGYGKQWMDADNREKRLQVITDVEDCATFIKKNWAFDGVVPKVGVLVEVTAVIQLCLR
jgi:dipeptidyl aminopeptidase/acylaminoacyl peptidase